MSSVSVIHCYSSKNECSLINFGPHLVKRFRVLLWVFCLTATSLCQSNVTNVVFERRLDKFWSKQEIRYDFKKCLKIVRSNKAPDESDIGSESEANDDDRDLAIEVT